MATDKLINQSQGDEIIDALDDIATNLGNISYGEQTSADKVVAMTGYEKASTAEAISQADTLNEAVGKLEKKVDDNATAIDSKVSGPSSSYTNAIAVYSDTTGKVLADSQYRIAEEYISSSSDIPTCMMVDDAIMATASELADLIGDKLDKTANAASAAKLNNGSTDYEVGSATKGVYFDDGIPKAMTCSVETNVPQNAVFTDTTYSNGTGISINSSNQINHSNSVTKQDTASALKVAYDAQGHITDSSPLAASDIGAVPTSRTVNSKALSDNITLSGDDIKLTSYTKGTSTDAVAYTDKVNEAIAKHENRIDVNKNNILYNLNMGVKNWILMSNKVLSYNGLSITRTPNEIQISGTATKTFSLLLTGNVIEQQISDPADYVVYSKLPNSVNLSGTPDNQNKNRIIVALYLGTTWVYSFSSQTTMPVDLSNYTYDRWYAYISIDYGVAYSGTWKPFLKDSSITDNTFVPGALPNYDLTRLEIEDRNNIIYNTNNGVKNICNNGQANNGVKSVHNTTFTTFPDGTVTVKTPSGETSDTDTNNFYNVWFVDGATVVIPKGTWMCKLYGTDISNIRIEYAYTLNGSNILFRGDFGEAFEMIIPPGITASWLRICAKPSTSFNSSFKIVDCNKAAWEADPPAEYIPYALPNSELTSQLMEINQLVRDTQPIYGYRIAKNNLDPDTRVEYLFDAVGMTPAYMNFSTGQFNYGSWGDIWFIKNNKPVALNFDGTEAFELNPTNYWQKSDGTTAIDIEDASLNYNYMSRIPTVYVKRWEDSQYNYVAFTQYPQGGFTAYAHQGASGRINENMYLPMFKGFKDSNGKLRSLAGKTPWNTTGGIGYELDAAKAIATTNNGWQIWDFAKHELISDLLTLISKNTSSRWKFGKGVIKTASSTAGFCKGGYEYDGTTKATCAQFWGTDEGTGNTPSTEDGSHHVRVFHIEDLWGNRWDRCLGLHLINGIYKVKMFAPYYATAPTGSGALLPDETYETLSLTPPSGNYLQNQSTGFYGNIPISTSGDKNKGYCSYFWQSSGADRLLIFGGRCGAGFTCSARYLNLAAASVDSGWSLGASPCFNHL